MLQDPDISVIICTYNRSDLLRMALDSVLVQEASGFHYEVIVVDNNSSDNTAQVIESYVCRHANVHHIFEVQQGNSHAKNAGISHSRAPFLVFTDDDVRALPVWLRTLKRAYDADPISDYFGGKVLPRWPLDPPIWLTPSHWAPLALVDYGDDPFYADAAKPVCLVGANLAVRRNAFERCGLFRAEFQRVRDGIGSLEDDEFQRRVWRMGGRGLYVPEAVVEAEIQLERLAKEYHRRWHMGHGRFYARLRSAEMEQGRVGLYGVPMHVYRTASENAVGWLIASAKGDETRAFKHEKELHFCRGFISECRKAFKEKRRLYAG